MPDLPSGTVTFLFTDVEGSTQLLHDLGPERYAETLAEHRRLIREACAAEGGVEVDTQGDAFFFAFAIAPNALRAAQAGQEALASGAVQVRMGLHTGAPSLTDEGYVGDDVHLAARVAASAHGGQVVATRATEALVDGFELIQLGEHRLKDIEQPVAIVQLGAAAFPPLKTISNTNLPRPASSFVGREHELAEALERVRGGARLLTLTGPGGTGKTRLALEAASELVPDFKAGVFWVGLAALREPALVSEHIAQVLGAKGGVAEHVGERELLLLLDNLEQVVDAALDLASLLEACPNLHLLVTSRVLLRVRGEVEYAVPPLANIEAVRLFCERAQLEPTDDVVELCRRLDSLPLAVELAAARARVLTPLQILERLSQRLDLLKGGRDADPRQRTLRATIAWSYDLLDDDERRLFRHLAVFAGGCTVTAAEEVADADLDTLQSLVEQSLVRFTDGRYWMLETIREYAAGALAGAGEEAHARERQLNFVRGLVADAECGSTTVRSDLADEIDNFRAALEWAERADDPAAQLELVGRSWPFWWFRGSPAEGRRWVETALARCPQEDGTSQVQILSAGAMFAYRLGEVDRIRALAERALEIASALDEERLSLWPLILLGIWAGEVGDFAESGRLYETAIERASRAGEYRLVGAATNNLGVNSVLEGDYEAAVRHYARVAADLGDVRHRGHRACLPQPRRLSRRAGESRGGRADRGAGNRART